MLTKHQTINSDMLDKKIELEIMVTKL